jgi:hypothetical protein
MLLIAVLVQMATVVTTAQYSNASISMPRITQFATVQEYASHQTLVSVMLVILVFSASCQVVLLNSRSMLTHLLF